MRYFLQLGDLRTFPRMIEFHPQDRETDLPVV